MKKTTLIFLGIAATFYSGFFFRTIFSKPPRCNADIIKTYNYINLKNESNLKLGAFSVSLNVRDINASKQFYENLGFTVFAGGPEKNYLIMKNENSLIGLFQGMFEGNILTFNPGWDENGANLKEFDDVREIQRQLKSKGIKLTVEADENTSGPAGIMTADPDGNVILIDQHR